MTTKASLDLADRILDCFPGGSYALCALLRLMDIEASDRVPTAAVECRAQPRLLMNSDFVERHARSPEKLLMLVMHELHHVLLGHTTLFPVITPVQNFVFDCVINALLCRMFPRSEHLAFFTELYSDQEYPECLLRPPAGWRGEEWTEPPAIAALPKSKRRQAAAVHRALYSATGATYHEVHSVLPQEVSEEQLADIPLLGNHDLDGSAAGGLDSRAPILFDIVRGIVEQWPQPPDPIAGRSLSDLIKESRVRPRRPPSARAVLRRLIDEVAATGKMGHRKRLSWEPVVVNGPLPSFNRRSIVLRALGVEPLLHPALVATQRPVPSGERVHIYLDVSGSVEGVRNALYGAVLDVRERVHPQVHLFSTKVADVSLGELREGKCATTGGTDIGCVAEHMKTNRVRRALIVTDGFVGRPVGSHEATLAQARLAIGYVGDAVNESDLVEVANYGRRVPLGG